MAIDTATSEAYSRIAAQPKWRQLLNLEFAVSASPQLQQPEKLFDRESGLLDDGPKCPAREGFSTMVRHCRTAAAVGRMLE